MKKTFLLEDLDCAHCAAKLERAVGAVPGVKGASVNFLLQKLTVEADDGEFDDVMKLVVKAARKSNPDVTVKLR